MKLGLLAPQFGLGRITQTARDEPVPAPPPATAPAPAPAGPTIILKRRRLVEDPRAASNADAGSVPAGAKLPKVHRLDALLPPPPESPPAAAEERSAVAPLPAPKPRRRQDPVRHPTLIRHVVYETPPPQQAPGDEAAPAAEGSVSGKDVHAAMARLGETLDGLIRAHDAYVDLDRHLRKLRIPGSGAGPGRTGDS
jgi:hypothetical protein